MSVRLTCDAGVAHILLARPEQLNAIDAPLLQALDDACAAIESVPAFERWR